MALKGLRGCVAVSEIVFVGHCEVVVCLDFGDSFCRSVRCVFVLILYISFFFFFPLSREAHRSAKGVSIL